MNMIGAQFARRDRSFERCGVTVVPLSRIMRDDEGALQMRAPAAD